MGEGLVVVIDALLDNVCRYSTQTLRASERDAQTECKPRVDWLVCLFRGLEGSFKRANIFFFGFFNLLRLFNYFRLFEKSSSPPQKGILPSHCQVAAMLPSDLCLGGIIAGKQGI